MNSAIPRFSTHLYILYTIRVFGSTPYHDDFNFTDP